MKATRPLKIKIWNGAMQISLCILWPALARQLGRGQTGGQRDFFFFFHCSNNYFLIYFPDSSEHIIFHWWTSWKEKKSCMSSCFSSQSPFWLTAEDLEWGSDVQQRLQKDFTEDLKQNVNSVCLARTGGNLSINTSIARHCCPPLLTSTDHSGKWTACLQAQEPFGISFMGCFFFSCFFFPPPKLLVSH